MSKPGYARPPQELEELRVEVEALREQLDEERATCSKIITDLRRTKGAEAAEERLKLAEQDTRAKALEEAAQIGDQVAKEQYEKDGYKEHRHTYSMIIEGASETSRRIRALKEKKHVG